MRGHVADVLKIEIMASVKESIGFNDELAENVAEKLLGRLQLKWGGRDVYIPAQDSKERNQAIKNEFNGENHVEVCKKYDISLSTLYRTVR